ncbi:MAG: HEPN domain-containing protein [Promethearchaeota archaeon]|nr:MAG: HEPN domain-containing protein [Candidatus Lokiarchaeota archaeon]
MNRYKDWLNQSDEDYQAAVDSKNNKHFEWACFQAQQAAEKALKALLLFINFETWGHGLMHLLKEWNNLIDDKEEPNLIIEEKTLNALIEKCQELDMHYIQPRYPNGFTSGYPAEYYNEKIAKNCINNAKIIIKFVKEKIEEISSSE